MPGIAYLNTVSDYIHKRCMIHHDINLENVLVGQEVSPSMVDFGYSHSWTPWRAQRSLKKLGSTHYASPESWLRNSTCLFSESKSEHTNARMMSELL